MDNDQIPLFSEQAESDAPSLENFDYVVKRQRRKTIALHVLTDGSVEVRAPKWVSKKAIAEFVEERSGWVIEQRVHYLEKAALSPQYCSGAYHDYLGEPFILEVVSSTRSSVSMVDGVLLVRVKEPMDKVQVKSALEHWYARQAKIILPERLAYCYQQLPIEILDYRPMPELKLRKMRSRWGSCSSQGVVTLNTLLMQYAPDCIDYVVFHELCHLWEFNHSKAFYRLMDRVMPSWQSYKGVLDNVD